MAHKISNFEIGNFEEVVSSTAAIRESARAMELWDIMSDRHSNELDDFCTFCSRKWRANHHVRTDIFLCRGGKFGV